ncbi:MAG: MFS transporter [Acidimicrobiia bacterium]
MSGTGPGAPRVPLVTGRFAMVMLATLAYFTALGALLPTLPRYVEEELGGGGLAIGVVVGAFAVSAALARPWAGRLGDRHGRRVLVTGGCLVAAASQFAYALTDAVVPLTALRLVTGVGEAAVFVGAATAAQDMAPDERRGEAASYFSTALYGGLALGPILGEVVADRHGYHAAWIVAGAASALGAVFGWWTPAVATAPVPSVRPALLHPSAIGPGLVLVLALAPFTAFSAFVAVYGEEVGMTDVAPVFLLYAGVVVVVRIFGARLPDRLGWERTSSIAIVALAAGILVVAAWASAPAVWLGAVGLGLGMAALYPAMFSAALQGVPQSERSRAVSTFTLFFDLAGGLGAPVLGLVVALSSNRGAFLVAGVLALAAFWPQHLMRTRSRPVPPSPR